MYKLSISKLYEVKNENKKTLTKVALTTGLALTAVAPYGVGHAEETDQLQVQIQEESFRSGELTQPSQKAPENVVKDALKEKTEQALSSKQVNGETGVDYKVLQNVIHMMGLHLYVYNKHMKEKKYMAIN